MNLSLKKEFVKKIGSDTFAIDFGQAEQLSIKLHQNSDNLIESSSMAVSMDGTLYLNLKHKDYQVLREIYEMFNDASTENLIMAYKIYDTKYPDVYEPEDVDNFKGKFKGEAMAKVLLKYELLRREYKAAKIQPLMNLLFHGECN
jgi:hypothetical protein